MRKLKTPLKQLKQGGTSPSTPLQRSIPKSKIMKPQAYPDGGKVEAEALRMRQVLNPGEYSDPKMKAAALKQFQMLNPPQPQTFAPGTAEPMQGLDDPIFNLALMGYGAASKFAQAMGDREFMKDANRVNKLRQQSASTRIANRGSIPMIDERTKLPVNSGKKIVYQEDIMNSYKQTGGQGDHLNVFPMVMDHGGQPCFDCGGKSGDSNFPKDIPSQRKNDFLDWIRQTSMERVHQDLDNDLNEFKKGGHWIQGAVNPKHKGYCTPMTKATCTPKRKAFAMTMKKHHGFHKEDGGELNQFPRGGPWEDQGYDYSDWGSPNAQQFQFPQGSVNMFSQDNRAYHPAWDYIPNTGQRSYEQISYAGPGNQTNQGPFGTQDFPAMAPQGPSVQNDPGVYNNPQWTDQDLDLRNKMLSMDLPRLQSDKQGLQNKLNQNQQIVNTSPENYPTISKKTVRPDWKDRWWANPDILNAGMEGLTNVINNLPGGANQRHKDWLRKTTSADYWNSATRGSRGDYVTNNGYFRPDQTTPVQFRGQAGFYKDGGEYILSDEEVQKLRSLGHNFEEIE